MFLRIKRFGRELAITPLAASLGALTLPSRHRNGALLVCPLRSAPQVQLDKCLSPTQSGQVCGPKNATQQCSKDSFGDCSGSAGVPGTERDTPRDTARLKLWAVAVDVRSQQRSNRSSSQVSDAGQGIHGIPYHGWHGPFSAASRDIGKHTGGQCRCSQQASIFSCNTTVQISGRKSEPSHCGRGSATRKSELLHWKRSCEMAYERSHVRTSARQECLSRHRSGVLRQPSPA